MILIKYLACLFVLQCVRNIEEAFAQVDAYLDTHQRDKLMKDFNLCENLQDQDDVYFFVQLLANNFREIVQNSVGPQGMIGKFLCPMMTHPDRTPYESLKNTVNVSKIAMTKRHL